MSKAPILENWSVVSVGDEYTPPEHRYQVLSGTVYGHARFPDGKEITTSPICGKVDHPELVATKSGSRYALGDPDPVYEQSFPGARARLLGSLPILPLEPGAGRPEAEP